MEVSCIPDASPPTSEHVFFVFGFAKNEKDNIKQRELRALKAQAKTLGGLSTDHMARALQYGALVEVEQGNDHDQKQKKAQ